MRIRPVYIHMCYEKFTLDERAAGLSVELSKTGAAVLFRLFGHCAHIPDH